MSINKYQNKLAVIIVLPVNIYDPKSTCVVSGKFLKAFLDSGLISLWARQSLYKDLFIWILKKIFTS